MNVIGIDLGGTKVVAAVVTPQGRILGEKSAPTDLSAGWPGLKKQLLALIRNLITDYGRVKCVGIGSAGPLHAPSGKLLDPTNFGWKPSAIAIAGQLENALKIPVRLENDAAAAVLAEHWKGGGGKNCVVLTLGTGLGVGVILGGKLLRGARGLHPEAGHLVLRPGDASAQCGCGVLGCAEAYLSGMNFGKRASTALKRPGLTGKDVAELAARKDPAALRLFAEYSELLAAYMLNMVVLFYPEKIILTGSFANAHEHFLPAAQTRLRELISRRLETLPIMPKITVSKLGNRAGVLGAGYVALHKNYTATT